MVGVTWCAKRPHTTHHERQVVRTKTRRCPATPIPRLPDLGEQVYVLHELLPARPLRREHATLVVEHAKQRATAATTAYRFTARDGARVTREPATQLAARDHRYADAPAGPTQHHN